MKFQVPGFRFQKNNHSFWHFAGTWHLVPSTSRSRAFTLIELLVVCAIIILVTAIVFANQSKYSGQVLLQSFAYDVALSIRQAQVYGISVHHGAGGGFSAGYGVHFNMSDPTHYELFADTAVPPTGMYQAGEDVSPSPYNINRGYYISKLCAPAGSDNSCSGGTSVNILDILFVRPEPDAWIAAGGAACYSLAGPTTSCQPSARIVLKSPSGDTMAVSVSNNGQISVDQKVASQ